LERSGVSHATVNDIQFISSGGRRHQRRLLCNIGTTRRQGVELALETRTTPLALTVRYTFLDATFQSSFSESSPSNSSANADGVIEVARGDRIPANPRHVLKIRADWVV